MLLRFKKGDLIQDRLSNTIYLVKGHIEDLPSNYAKSDKYECFDLKTSITWFINKRSLETICDKVSK